MSEQSHYTKVCSRSKIVAVNFEQVSRNKLLYFIGDFRHRRQIWLAILTLFVPGVRRSAHSYGKLPGV